MNTQKIDMNDREDTREVAAKLDEIFYNSPENYFYLKGFIHCLAQKNKNSIGRPYKPTVGRSA